ncbi:MAG: hypothetical protein U9Q81_18425 [Pseudomonadota bacterium]|nr:hypothetical protein [Pseudomonadota bacterium]
MNYLHARQAGNFADVFKHALLSRLLLAMGRDDAPFLYLETHAGAGRYEFAERDVGRIRDRTDAPPTLPDYHCTCWSNTYSVSGGTLASHSGTGSSPSSHAGGPRGGAMRGGSADSPT